MNRVLLNFTVSLLVGFVLPQNMTLYVLILSILLLIGILHFLLAKRFVVLTLIIGLFAGIFASNNVKSADKRELYTHLNSSIPCVVNVDSVPVKTDSYTKFTASLPEFENEKIIVYIYDAPDIKVNQQLKLDEMSIRLPGTKLNFGSFDYRKYLTGKNIYFQGSANAKNILEISHLPMNLLRLATATNAMLCDKIDNSFSSENAAILKGVLLGDKSDLSEEVEEAFRNSGLSHVLAVSGLHLTMITMLFGMLIRKTSRWVKIPLLSLVVIVFAFVTGLSASVVRAAIMLLMIYIGDFMYAESDTLTNLSLAALILFIINPNCIYDTGFVLSFSATLGIVVLFNPISSLFPQQVPSYFKDCISVSISAQIGTLPFLALSFSQLSTMAVISNLLIGLLMPVIFALCGLSLIFPVSVLLISSEFVLNIFIKWAGICSKIPGQIIHIPINIFVISGLFVFSITALLNSFFKSKKIPVAIMLLSLVFATVSAFAETLPPGKTTITFISVGQADSALVETPDGNRFLVDCGTESMAENEVVDYLTRNGIFNLDGIFISHFNDDHSGGIISVLDEIDTDVVYIPDTKDVGKAQYELIEYSRRKDISLIPLSTGDKISFSDLEIFVLNPASKIYADGDNDSSLVIKAENSDVSVLFTGDIIKDNLLDNCDTDILKVSHHGSKNGTTEEFLTNNTPKVAVISLGINNMYGFPKQETLDKILKYTNKIYRTDLNGTVEIICSNKTYTVRTLRGEENKWKN